MLVISHSMEHAALIPRKDTVHAHILNKTYKPAVWKILWSLSEGLLCHFSELQGLIIFFSKRTPWLYMHHISSELEASIRYRVPVLYDYIRRLQHSAKFFQRSPSYIHIWSWPGVHLQLHSAPGFIHVCALYSVSWGSVITLNYF